MENRHTSQDISDRFITAVHVAGQAVIAVRSGMGIAEARIERAQFGHEDPYIPICTPRRKIGAASTLRFLVAGEAATVALGLSDFEEVDLLSEHRAAAALIRNWDGYWGNHPHLYSLHDDWSVDGMDEESKHLIGLARWQMRRRFRYDPERSAIESLANQISNGKLLSGADVETFVRTHCRSNFLKSSSVNPIQES